MKVFISWSGKTSREIAMVLYKWLDRVIHHVEPFVSTEIEKGRSWYTTLRDELENTNFGIVCLTPTNLQKPWILFEAGALAKTVARTYVVPFLFRLEPSNVEGPLSHFMAVRATSKEDVHRLVITINRALGDKALSDNQLNDTFEAFWPKLVNELDQIQLDSDEEESVPKRSESEILEEVLEIVRQIGNETHALRSDIYTAAEKVLEAQQPLLSPLSLVNRPILRTQPHNIQASDTLLKNIAAHIEESVNRRLDPDATMKEEKS